jgi:hypothetical protein
MNISHGETDRFSAKAMTRGSGDFFLTSCVVSVVIAATAFSFPRFFLYVPFARGMDVLSFLGFFALLGWVLMMVVPPLLLNPKITNWRSSHLYFLLGSVLIYPLSTLGVKILGLVSLGEIWIQYLLNYPILLAIEWLFPILYMGVGLFLSRRNS